MQIRLFKYIKAYLIIYGIAMLTNCLVHIPGPMGEWDDYTLMSASLIAPEHNFSITESDIAVHKQLFPEWSRDIDFYRLSGYVAKDGGEMAWYFPTYSIVSIPFIIVLYAMKLPTIYAFAFTNLFFLLISLLVVLYCLDVGEKKKALLIAALSLNPIVFYLGWPSAEVFIYAFLVITMVCWYNHWYKRAALSISVAGMLNMTVMCIGFLMIGEYLLALWKDRKKNENIAAFIKENICKIFIYGSCYIIGLIPMIYNYYNVGHINLTASQSNYVQARESTLERFWSYIFDLNYGLLPYFGIMLIGAIVLLIVAILHRHWRYLEWMFALVITILLYSIMIHINCGMSGISRYNSWGAVILIFAVCLFYDEIIRFDKVNNIIKLFLYMSTILTGILVFYYGPNKASHTSYVQWTPIARFVLDKYPQLYNPLHSTFNSRVNHLDGGYHYVTPIIYTADDGYVRKILATANDKGVLSGYESLEGNDEWLKAQIDKLTSKESYISISSKYRIINRRVYEIGTPIWFYTNQYNASNYVTIGTSFKEEEGTWTDGNVLELSLVTNGDSDILHGVIDSDTFNGEQRVQIYSNNKLVYSGVATGSPILFDINNPGIGETVDLKVVLPDAVSPFELNLSNDTRKLALRLKTITFTE